jgi:hypothetical protein
MNSCKFLLFFLFLYDIAYSQLEKCNFKLTSRYDEVHSHIDENGNLYLIFQKGKKAEIKVFNHKFELSYGRTLTIPKYDQRFLYLEMVCERRGIKVYFYHARKRIIYSVHIDKTSTTEPYINEELVLASNELFLAAFNYRERFYLLTHKNDTDTLYFTTIESNGERIKVDLKTNISNLTHLIVKNSNMIDSKIHSYKIVNMNKLSENFFLKASADKKFYIYGKKMVVTLDEASKTYILEINLISGSLKTKIYNFHLDRCSDENIVSGISNFSNGFLYRLTYCKEQLNLSIIETDSSLLRRNFNIYKDYPINFKNSSVTQITDHNGFKEQEIVIIENTSKFLRILEDLKLSLNIFKLSFNQIYLKLGGIDQSYASIYASGGRSPKSPSVGIGFGMGYYGLGSGVGISPFGTPFYSTQNYVKLVECSFVSILNIPDFEHVEGHVSSIPYEKAIKFSKSKGNFYDVLGFIDGNDYKIFYGFLSEKDDLYKIIEFTL